MNFTENQAAGFPSEDLVQDGWTEISRRIRAKIIALPPDQRTPENMLKAWEDADFEKMEDIRRRAETIVEDKETADKLKAWYRQLCKRPCFHDQYLQAFNRPNVTLVDTDGKGVERITETGVVVAGREYALDCLIYASGFEVGTEFIRRTGFDLEGRGGERLSQHWAEGMRTKHGLHVNGFPNAFFVQPTQGANLISNVPHNLSDSAKTIACIVAAARDRGAQTVEVTAEAEEAWVKLLLTGPGMMIGSQDCTPGYYNNEGKTGNRHSFFEYSYGAGPLRFFEILKDWRASGTLEGSVIR
jgi:cation diffusion facilitator CzcD-associated flavoprotein CzcO